MTALRGELRLPGLSKGRALDLSDVPISACVGYNGMGKSAMAVAIAMRHLDAGRPVLSTVRLLDWRNPRPCDDETCVYDSHGDEGHMAAHPLWRAHNDFRQLFDFTDGHILWDEATGVADAREHAAMPVQVANYLPQLRRRQVTLTWTTIHWSFADVRLRRVTQASCWAVGLAGKNVPGEMWKRNRLFYYRTFDAKNIPDDFDMSKRDKTEVKAMTRAWLWGPRSDVFRAYSSADAVLSLGSVNDAGMCLGCGGKRAAPRCECDRVAPTAGRSSRRKLAVAPALDVVETTGVES